MLTFEQFRAKLADVVTVAINSGRPVGDRYCRCPLAAHPELAAIGYPASEMAAKVWGCDRKMLKAFINGYGGSDPKHGRMHRAAFKLGLLYRERFKLIPHPNPERRK